MFLFSAHLLRPTVRHVKMLIAARSVFLLQPVNQTGKNVLKQNNRPANEKIRHIIGDRATRANHQTVITHPCKRGIAVRSDGIQLMMQRLRMQSDVDQIARLPAFGQDNGQARLVAAPHHIHRRSIVSQNAERCQTTHKVRRSDRGKAQTNNKNAAVPTAQQLVGKRFDAVRIHGFQNACQVDAGRGVPLLFGVAAQGIHHIAVTLIPQLFG